MCACLLLWQDAVGRFGTLFFRYLAYLVIIYLARLKVIIIFRIIFILVLVNRLDKLH